MAKKNTKKAAGSQRSKATPSSDLEEGVAVADGDEQSAPANEAAPRDPEASADAGSADSPDFSGPRGGVTVNSGRDLEGSGLKAGPLAKIQCCEGALPKEIATAIRNPGTADISKDGVVTVLKRSVALGNGTRKRGDVLGKITFEEGVTFQQVELALRDARIRHLTAVG